MTIPATLYVVTDIETTAKKKLAFDVAWRTIDKNNKLYDSGSYLATEVFADDIPWFKEKMGEYFEDVAQGLIIPSDLLTIREHYNKSLQMFRAAGHRVILCAYNAAFDFKWLPYTFTHYHNTRKFLTSPAEIMDIWDYWGQSVPLCYNAAPSASGKFRSTTAEAAYTFEKCLDTFEERHIAWHDCIIEAEILVKALKRKQKRPIVTKPSDLEPMAWKAINTRLGIDGSQLIAA